MRRLLVFCVLSAVCGYLHASPEVCTNTILPGSKGDQGEVGEVGELGRLGKTGPPGPPGLTGESGLKGQVGHVGKTGPLGDKGDKGDTGLGGDTGLKGKPGTTCDCGRYRKVIGQLDINVGKLRNAVNFVKDVILGLRETEDTYYLLVKEARRFREALVNCKLRGGNLAMPKSRHSNRLIADYVNNAGLTRVFIGLQVQTKDSDGTKDHVYTDSSPLREFAAWSQGEAPALGPVNNSSCVELHSTGSWGHIDCDANMFYVCEFPKSRRRGGGGGGGRGGEVAPPTTLGNTE